MEHITTEYGKTCNLLELTRKEYNALEPFLLALGVRTRSTMSHYKSGVEILKIQAENPYKTSLCCYRGLNDVISHAFKFAEREMRPDAISCYKR